MLSAGCPKYEKMQPFLDTGNAVSLFSVQYLFVVRRRPKEMLLAREKPELRWGFFLKMGNIAFFMCVTNSSLGRNPKRLLLVGYGITYRFLETHKSVFSVVGMYCL